MSHRKLQLHISRILALALAVLLLLPGLPAARAAEASGTSGGLSWELSGGTLSIYGSGHMANYGEFDPAPWAAYADEITAVRLEGGVRSVGEFAFFQMDKITSVTMASSVKSVGRFAFYNCTALTMLDLGKVKEIGTSAFERCSALTSVRLPGSLTVLGANAFYRCESLLAVTVPSSVKEMGDCVFGYCTSLQSASVLASMEVLPRWSFYGCYELSSVTLAPAITAVGASAFEHCEVTQPEQGKGSAGYFDTTTQQQNGATVTTNSSYSESSGGTVSSQITTTQTTTDQEVDATVDAVLENSKGWKDVSKEVDAGLKSAATVTADIWLKGDTTVSGDDLGRFAGKNVTLTIHTSQGATWHVNGMDIDPDDLTGKYDLSFAILPLTEPTEAQAAAVGDCRAFTVVFDKTINFKVQVELPVGKELARNTAVFFDPDKESYTRAQSVVIDGQGIAHFYLAKVAAGTEYLIGINVPAPVEDSNSAGNTSNAIIPPTMNEYPNLVQLEEIEYVVTGVKTPLDMNIQQLTIIIVAVLVISFIVVGFVIFAMNKKKLKNGYVPVFDDEDE